MNTASQQRGDAASATGTNQRVTEVVQQGFAAWMTIPQRLVQANIESLAETINFMNRRMKAQAAMLSDLGQMANGGSFADTQRHLIETMSREFAEEAQELGVMARKNLETIVHLVEANAGKGTTGRTS